MGGISAWPLVGQSTWRADYGVGFAQATNLIREAGAYFFLNPGWSRGGGLFSHAGALWSGGTWQVQVWFLRGGRRRRWRPKRGRTPQQKIYALRGRIGRKLRRLRPKRPRVYHRRGRLLSAQFRVLPRKVRPPRRRLGYPRVLTRIQRPKWASTGGGKWNRLLRMKKHHRRGPLLEMSHLWSVPRGGTWSWVELSKPHYWGVATLLARMKYRLGGRIEMRARRVALPLLRAALRLGGAIGAEVRCHGRFSRRQRASHEVFRAGKLGRTDTATPQEAGFATVPLRFGAVGITLTVSYSISSISNGRSS